MGVTDASRRVCKCGTRHPAILGTGVILYQQDAGGPVKVWRIAAHMLEDNEETLPMGTTPDPARLVTCHWLRLDRDRDRGVCSACPLLVEAWDAGDHDGVIFR